MAASIIGCLAFAAIAGSSVAALAARSEKDSGATSVRDVADRSSRSEQRSPEGSTMGSGSLVERARADPSVTPTAPAATPAATPAVTPSASPPATVRKGPPPSPKPVAGLSQLQMNNAAKIVAAGQAMGLAKRAYVLAIACALQESNLHNLASYALPESFNYPNEGAGSDHDSVGLFQQRPSAGWGTVKNLMKPDYAAKAFYRALIQVPGWSTMELTWAVQSVQMSAFPYAYAPHEARAQTIVNALT
jgi:hypothetical protein